MIRNRTFFTKSQPWMAVAVFLAAAFALYANTFANGWTYDDFPVIVENPDVSSWSQFLQDSYPGRPLRELTYLLDHALFGLNPAGWHIQNIFWHGLNAFLVYLLAARLGASRFVAWCSAGLFLVHPLMVEVVANTSHRKDSLALAFSLLALLAYDQAFRRASPVPKGLWILGAAALGLTAFQAKQNAVALPLVFVAYEYAFISAQKRVLLRRPLLFWLAGLIAAGAFLWWFFQAGGQSRHLQAMESIMLGKSNYFGAVDYGVYCRTVLKSWAFSFSKLLYPVDLALEYVVSVPRSWASPWVLGALAGIALYVAVLLRAARKWPLVFLSLVWIAVFWLPVSNVWPLTYLSADRYLYAVAPAFLLLVAIAWERICPNRQILVAVPLLVTVAFCGLTWRQNSVWRSPETLWSHAVEVSPDSSFALNNMGNIHLLRGETGAASAYYERAVEANPINATAHYNLGMIYEQAGDLETALSHYRKFLAIDAPMYREQAAELRKRLTVRYRVRL